MIERDFTFITQLREASVVPCKLGGKGKAGEERGREGNEGGGSLRKEREGQGVEGKGRCGKRGKLCESTLQGTLVKQKT